MFPFIFMLCLLPLPGCTSTTLTIGAFNIKIFGPTKSKNEVVMEHIKQIIFDYDIILIQEIRDKSQSALERLYKILNSVDGVKYSFIKSSRLGRTSSKEQYAFYYRPERVDVIGTYQFNDTLDWFEREPFSVLLRIPLSNEESLLTSLVALHAKPTEAVSEIDRLDEVYAKVKEMLYEENAIILGDLNAGCSYANTNSLGGTEVFSNTDFVSLIDISADTTTTATTNCAYDRFLVKGTKLLSMSPVGEVDLFNIRLGLNYDQTTAVSDHYPVKMTLQLPTTP